MKKLYQRLFYVLIFWTSFNSFSQIEFKAYAEQKFGFSNDSIPVKSLLKSESDFIKIVGNYNNLTYFIDSSEVTIEGRVQSDSSLIIELPRSEDDYVLTVISPDSSVNKLLVDIHKSIVYDVSIVSLTGRSPNLAQLESYLNQVYSSASVKFQIVSSLLLQDSILPNKLLSNPSSQYDYYTDEMHRIRDYFFNSYPNADKSTLYLFMIDGFINPDIQGYMVQNKALAFFKDTHEDTLFHSIAKELGRGIGGLSYLPDSSNLMNDGTSLNPNQWSLIQEKQQLYSYYDADEELMTNNGLFAYYFWKQDSLGKIQLVNNDLLQSINRPFKKNYTTYHLNIKNALFITAFTVYNFEITWLHLLLIMVLLTSFVFIARKINKSNSTSFQKKLYHRLLQVFGLVLLSLLIYGIEFFVQYQLDHYKVHGGIVPELHNNSVKASINKIQNNKELRHHDEEEIGSEILINTDTTWTMLKRQPVLYFNVSIDSTGKQLSAEFISAKDSLISSKYRIREKALSHYLVVTYYQDKKFNDQKIFNHSGIELSNYIGEIDAAKRILVFVNGYRPTSLGRTLEENFQDIMDKGLEYQNSINLIYSFDRYDYWQPWNEIDTKFKQRINTSSVYYADGHHAVSTSNHRSLINFTKLSQRYPPRCKDSLNHVCYKQLKHSIGMVTGHNERTTSLLPVKSNNEGFNFRKEKGRIAGKNLLMLLNEKPNSSLNDTLYIVAHSMGFAYAQGMLEELKDKINFGGYYIIAPENAAGGEVNINQWQEVWHYGVDLLGDSPDEPCLQDGIAPQTEIQNFNLTHRVYFPKNQFKKKGFFNSHFIGYYTWLFTIKENEKGFIRQR